MGLSENVADLFLEEIRKRDARIAELERQLKHADSCRAATAKITAERDEAVKLLAKGPPHTYRQKCDWIDERTGFFERIGAGKCKREGCNEPLAYPGAVYCGAACCALAEAGE